jgi:hypothetical protein
MLVQRKMIDLTNWSVWLEVYQCIKISATLHSSAKSDIIELNLSISSKVTVEEVGDYVYGVKK